MGAAVSHCISWLQTQFILTACQICYPPAGIHPGRMSAGVLPTGTEKEGSFMHADSEYIIGLSSHHDARN